MFPAGAAAEILAGHKNLGLTIRLLVKDEVRQFLAVIVIAHFEEQ